jgi:hypothetical protein
MLRNSAIWDVVSPAYTLLKQLDASISMNPPITSDEKNAQIGACMLAIENLTNPFQPDTIWNLDYDWQVFWTDAGIFYSSYWTFDQDAQIWEGPFFVDVGYGAQSPPPNPDGATVFAYRYGLPAYLLAISCLLAVAGSFDQNFPANPSYQSLLADAASFLQNKHDQIKGAITILTPFVTPTQPLGWTGVRIAAGQQPLAYSPAIIEYGAVELYSGYSVIESSYAIYDNDDPGWNNKLQLRALRKAKNVYAAIGLPAVWTTINQLLKLTGQAQIPRPSFADWSFRNEVIPTTGIVPDPSTGMYSLLAVAQFINNTLPIDTPIDQFQLSFFDLLTGADFPPLPTTY